MISDTLDDALSNIEEYQRWETSPYERWKDQIAFVKFAMEQLMVALHTPPSPLAEARFQALRRQAHFWCDDAHQAPLRHPMLGCSPETFGLASRIEE
jgi:hypothetical protein